MKLLQSDGCRKNGVLVLLLVIWGLQFWFFTSAEAANVPGVTTSRGKESKVKVPENMTAEEVDAYLAGLSDAQARQALAQQLKQGASGNSAPGWIPLRTTWRSR